MRVHTLGRWAGRVVAVAAIGMGTIAGTAVASDETASDRPALAEDSSAEPQGGSAATDGHEWT
jgi:hypothetical protein